MCPEHFWRCKWFRAPRSDSVSSLTSDSMGGKLNKVRPGFLTPATRCQLVQWKDVPGYRCRLWGRPLILKRNETSFQNLLSPKQALITVNGPQSTAAQTQNRVRPKHCRQGGHRAHLPAWCVCKLEFCCRTFRFPPEVFQIQEVPPYFSRADYWGGAGRGGAKRDGAGRGGAGVQLESAGNLGTPLPKGRGKDFGKWYVRFCVFLFLSSLGRLYALFSHPSLLPFGFVFWDRISFCKSISDWSSTLSLLASNSLCRLCLSQKAGLIFFFRNHKRLIASFIRSGKWKGVRLYCHIKTLSDVHKDVYSIVHYFLNSDIMCFATR